MWDVTADVLEFSEALDWFRSKVPMTAAQWRSLSEAAQRRAFFISGTAQLDIIQQVYDEIERAIKGEIGWEQFQKTLLEKLETAWAGSVRDPGQRLELIFRQNVQAAYSAGRWQQMSDPDLLKLRPYWMYDAVLDSRTSPICKNLHGTIRAAEDDWWESHYPPTHFQCRSGVRSLTQKQAEARGITEKLPLTEADVGFGKVPRLDDWKPDLKKYHPDLQKAAEKALESPPPQGFEEGKHVKRITGKGSAKDKATVTGAFEVAGVLDILERFPIDKLEVGARGVGRSKADGGYYRGLSYLQVKSSVGKGKFGKELKLGHSLEDSWALPYTAPSRSEYLEMVTVHELGHHLHYQHATLKDFFLDNLVVAAFEDPDKNPVSRYASTKPAEYFAESFTAYVYHREELRAFDPIGYAMIENALKYLRGKL